MRQIPDHHGTAGMGNLGDRFHVMLAARAVIHLGQHHDGDGVVDGTGHVLGGHGFKLKPLIQRVDQALHHVKIGGKVAGVTQDHLAAGPHFQGRGNRLIDLDRQRVAHHDRSCGGTNQAAYLVANARRLRHPSGIVPTPDQHLTPFIRNHARHPRLRCLGQRPKRIAVQVQHAFGQIEHLFAQHHHNSPLTCQSSGNSSTSSILRR